MQVFRHLLPLVLVFFCISYCFAQTTDLQFSHEAGFYEAPFNLSIKGSSPQFVYTTDGSTPNKRSKKYNGSIAINKTTALRVRSLADGRLSDSTFTRTYFIGLKTTFAVVSLVTDSANFFHKDTGIYVPGPNGRIVGGLWQGANWNKKWERPVHVEYFDDKGEMGFTQDAGIKIFGGLTKGFAEKSLRIIARKRYGLNRFKSKIFKTKDLDKFKHLVIRHSGNDFNKARFKDAMCSEFAREMNLDHQAFQPIILFFNGNCWGVYNLREKVNDNFLEDNHGAHKDSVDIIQSSSFVDAGSKEHFKHLKAFMKTNPMVHDSNYAYMQENVDIRNYINFRIIQCFLSNPDVRGNIRYWRATNLDAKWRWIFYDTDLGFGNTLRPNEEFVKMSIGQGPKRWFNPGYSTYFFGQLMTNKQFETEFVNQVAHLLNTMLSTEMVDKKIDKFYNRYKPEMIAHHFPNIKHHNERKWEGEIKKLHRFAGARPDHMRNNVAALFSIPGNYTINFKGLDFRKGDVYINDTKLRKKYCVEDSTKHDTTFLFTGQYYQGYNLPIRAEAAPGYRFMGWKEMDGEDKISLDGSQSSYTLTPIYERVLDSDKKDHLLVTELKLKPNEDKIVISWIELYNNTENPIDVTGWTLADEENEYAVEAGTVGGKKVIVLARKLKKFKKEHTDTALVAIDFDPLEDRENKDGIRLYDEQGRLALHLTIDLTKLDSTGLFNFYLKDGTKGLNDPENWATVDGNPSPGHLGDAFWATLNGNIFVRYWWVGVIALVLIAGTMAMRRGRRRR